MPAMTWLHSYGYLSLFLVLFLEIVGIPSLAESALIAAGLQVHRGAFGALPVLSVALAGSLAGSMLAYIIGRQVGRPFLEQFGPSIKITKEKLDGADDRFQKYGPAVLIIGKWLPGVQVLIPYLAGVSRLQIRSFLIYNTIGTVIWVTAFLTFGESLGGVWERAWPVFSKHGLLSGSVAVILTVLTVLWWARSRRSYRNRPPLK